MEKKYIRFINLNNYNNINILNNMLNDTNHVPNNINIPTFNVVIATIGRPNILNMLKSLESQLETEDCLTIIYDKCKPLKAIYNINIKCKIILKESGVGEPHIYVCGGGNLIRDTLYH